MGADAALHPERCQKWPGRTPGGRSRSGLLQPRGVLPFVVGGVTLWLTCEECGAVSETGEGWKACLGEEWETDESLLVVVYCPGCYERRFGEVLWREPGFTLEAVGATASPASPR
jgi:hypothetical protein